MKKLYVLSGLVALLVSIIGALLLAPQGVVFAQPVLTIMPTTWNVIGLDSNNVTVGPNVFPVPGSAIRGTRLPRM